MAHGGKRPGAGTKKGRRWASTLEKVIVREETRKYIQQHIPAMLRSQIAHAIGIGHVYTRDKKGKFSRIEDEAHIDRLLSEGQQDKDFWIFAKDPSVHAFSDLMDRAIDRPIQPSKVTGADDGPVEHVFRWQK
jgi:hypothetical protein